MRFFKFLMSKPILNDIRLGLTATCSRCKEMLITPPVTYESDASGRAFHALEQIFDRHVEKKHSRPVRE